MFTVAIVTAVALIVLAVHSIVREERSIPQVLLTMGLILAWVAMAVVSALA